MLRGVGKVSDFAVYNPSSADGSSNMAAELETFVSANQGKVVRVSDDVTILLNDFGQQGNLGATDHIRIDFGLAKIVYDNTSRCIDLDNTANASAEVTVSSITNKQIYSKSWVSEILLASTLNAEAHDWIAIYSADANPSISGGRMGEIHQLMDDEGSLLLHTVGTLGRPSADFATTVRARKLDSTRKLYLKGGIFSANGDADDTAITSREECIRITGFVDPVVLLPTFDAPWAQGLWLQCTGGALVDGLEIKNTLQMGDYAGYSYGCVLYGMNGNPIVRNTVARNCRHPGGTTDGNSSSTTTWYNKGYPTYYKFLNTHGYNCYGSVGDSHEEGIYGLWDGLHSHNAVQDESEVFVGSVFQGRAAMETVRNWSGIGGSRGLVFDDIDHGFEDEVSVENGTTRKLHNGSTTSYAIEFKDNSQTNKRRYRVSNVKSHDIDVGFYIGTNNLVHLDNCPVASAEAYADCKAGSRTIIKGMVSDHRNTTASGASSVFLCRSSVVDGGCEIICLDKPILIKGSASNLPTCFFDERDTLANKTVWTPGITEYNPDGVDVTLYKEAGSTTFVDATTISEVSVDGIAPMLQSKKITVSTAELKALFTTPITVIPAPGTGKIIVPEFIQYFLDYNSAAYDDIAAAENLTLRYTDGSGQAMIITETVGFLDQASDQHRVNYPYAALTGNITPVVNAPLVIHMASGNIATGDSPLEVTVFYRVVDV